jgi:hypothetical protein
VDRKIAFYEFFADFGIPDQLRHILSEPFSGRIGKQALVSRAPPSGACPAPEPRFQKLEFAYA